MTFHYAGRAELMVLIQISLCLFARANDKQITIGSNIYCQANIKTNATGITIRHSKGVASIDYMDMPTEADRIQHGYDEDLYATHKKMVVQGDIQQREDRRLREQNAAILRNSAAKAIRAEVDIKGRRGIYVFAEGDKIENQTERIEYIQVVERLKGPGMQSRDESITRHKILPVKIRDPFPKGLLIADHHNLLKVNAHWEGVLYPVFIAKKGIPVYTTNLQDVLLPEINHSSYLKLLKGYWHGVSIPPLLAKIGGLKLTELNERASFFYLSGLAMGLLFLLALLVVLVLNRKKRKKTVQLPKLPWQE